MGKNEELGLPFGKMRQYRVAFDVDGTLRCNCTETCTDPNVEILDLLRILSKFKNITCFIWSGGGAKYALGMRNMFGLEQYVKEAHCISKIGAPPMDIAIDDIQDTAIGSINLIVKQK
jgi:hypothetical protein